MVIQSFVFNQNSTNCYVIYDELTREGLIVDCGCNNLEDFCRLKKYISDNSIQLKYNFCTHLHFDHVFGNELVLTEYEILPIASVLDKDILEWNKMCSMFVCEDDLSKRLLRFNMYNWYNDEYDNLIIGENFFKIIHTPGHTQGSLTLYGVEKNVVVSGDVIFENGIGRTDFEGGDSSTLEKSLSCLRDLPSSTLCLPGHGKCFRLSNNSYLY